MTTEDTPPDEAGQQRVIEGGATTPDVTLPWAGDPRAPDKTEILETTCLLAAGSPEGVPLRQVLDAVFGDDWSSGGADYLLAHRLPEQHPELLEKHTPYGDLTWLHPTDQAVFLIRSRHECRTGGETPASALRQRGLPSERAAGVLRSVQAVGTDRQYGLLLKLLAYHRGTALEGSPGPEDEQRRKWAAVGTPGTDSRRRVPMRDRYTDEGRAKAVYARYEQRAEALEGLAEDCTDGRLTCATYTLPRECIDSVLDSVRVIREALRSLHARFGYSRADRPRPGEVPAYLAVLEPQGDMVAHLHVVYAAPRLMHHADLRADWAELLEVPAWKPQVFLRRLEVTPEGWQPVATGQQSPEVDAGQAGQPAVEAGEQAVPYGGEVLLAGDLRDYLRGPLRHLSRLAALPHADLHDRADALLAGEGSEQDRHLARQALYWPGEARYTTASQAVSEAAEGGV